MSKVSVIMPCFNDGRYIDEAIDSVLAQTYPDIELIIVDDCSTDERTIGRLESLKARFMVLKTPQNGGPAKARNLGIGKASGEFIFCLDSDDRIDPTYIEKAVRTMRSDDGLGIVYSRVRYFGQRDDEFQLPPYSLGGMLVSNRIVISSLFRRSDWELAKGFDEKLDGREDWDFWLSIIELGRGAIRIDEVLFHYRLKPRSRNAAFQDKSDDSVFSTVDQIRLKHRKLYLDNLDEFLRELTRRVDVPIREPRSRLVRFVKRAGIKVLTVLRH